MSPHEQQQILSAVAELYRNCGPVPTLAVATRFGYSDRHMRRILNELAETTKKIQRRKQRGGWLPIAC
jgi:hypothetical protein